MTIKKQLRQYVGRKNTRRIYQAMPWVGGALALAALNTTVGRRMLNRVGESLPLRDTAHGSDVDRPSFTRATVAK